MVNRISKLINIKHTKVYSIKPDATILQALRVMAEKDIGFLVVLEGGNISGVLSERDFVRKVQLLGKSSETTLVRDIMSTTVWTLSIDNTFEDAMSLMTSKRIRHVPVMDRGKVVGVISMRNVVEAFLGRQKETIQFLEEMALDR